MTDKARTPLCHPDRKHVANGLCRTCYNAIWYQTHREQARANGRAYYQGHRKQARVRGRVYDRTHREKRRIYNRAYYATHRQQMRARRLTTYRIDVQARLRNSLRARFHKALKGRLKTGSAVRDLGCTMDELIVHLESQFSEGMSWNNQGRAWHIDHIVPLASFDLTDRRQLLEACNWRNLRPMWSNANRSKHARIPATVQKPMLIGVHAKVKMQEEV